MAHVGGLDGGGGGLLMYIRKSNGPSMEPCGTPHRTGKHDDVCESIVTFRTNFICVCVIINYS